MKYLIIGHRGVGKSEFLKRVKKYYILKHVSCLSFDLDTEIEARTRKTISEIFRSFGEKYFREVEESILKQIFSENMNFSGPIFVAVGAGYSGSYPKDAKILWLRRPTDESGRIFLDRPRLNPEQSPYEEYFARFHEREIKFREVYHREIMIGEGWNIENDFETTLLGLTPANLKLSVTISSELIENEIRLEEFIESHLFFGVKYFELRNDLLSDSEIYQVAKMLPREKVLISFRPKTTGVGQSSSAASQELIEFSGIYDTDWALELGPSPLAHNKIISLHTRLAAGDELESIEEAAERLLSHKADHYKLAVPVNNFMELWAGHRFFSESTGARSFLPNSILGRWNWYRLLQFGKMFLNFARGTNVASPDQPTIFDFLRVSTVHSSKMVNEFAAVLGDPIIHSHTPSEHYDYFKNLSQNVVALKMSLEECNSLNLSILERLGLRAAAVTSPLKNKMVSLCKFLDQKSSELNSVNTIFLTRTGWSGTNTDLDGLISTFSNLDLHGDVVVWGGGGTRLALKTLFPNAHFFSARYGEEIWIENKNGNDNKRIENEILPSVLIWAVGRTRSANTQTPPTRWKPDYVFDLNYSDDSPGKEYALLTGAKYISGRGMFVAQAKIQREFFKAQEFSVNA